MYGNLYGNFNIIYELMGSNETMEVPFEQTKVSPEIGSEEYWVSAVAKKYRSI